MSLLRLVVIDEIEAAGFQMLNKIDSNLQETSSWAVVFRKVNSDENGINRAFGGMNMLMSGDFWQLQPTGDTAIMTNPENANLGAAKLT
eukprot:4761447-Karenia_brevis.AAC.1